MVHHFTIKGTMHPLFQSPCVSSHTHTHKMAGGSSSSSSSPIRAVSSRAFETFFDGWLVRQEHYLEELQSVLETINENPKTEYLNDLCARVFSHYKQYYEEKSRMCSRNIFLVFNPTWFTPFEKSFFWIAGFKPDLVYKVAAVAAADMTAEQRQRIDTIKTDIMVVEKALNAELARVQESVAAPELMAVGDRTPIDGEVGDMEGVLEELRVDLVAVVSNADELRTRTVEQVTAVLNSVQNTKFLAAATQLQLRIRTVGLEREERNNRGRN